MGQKITYTCDMCGKDAIITVDIYPTGKVPHGGSRDDLCMECLQIILETVSLPNAIDIFTKQDPPKVIKKPLRAKQPVVEKIPRGSEAVFVLAQAFIQLKEFKEAENLLREYLKITAPVNLAAEPLASKMLELLADTFYYQGRYSESFDALTQGLEMPSRSPELYKKLGILKGLDNKTQEAQEYFKLYEESLKH